MFSFNAAVNYDVGVEPDASPVAVLAAYINNDPYLDLVTANSGSDKVSVLLGSANGTFGPAIDSAAGYGPRSIAAGDFDGDGKLDLAAVSVSTNPVVSVMYGNGEGSFQSLSYIPLGRLATSMSDPVAVPMSVAVGDLNKDGFMDIAVAAGYNSHYPGYCCGGVETRVLVMLSLKDRTFIGPVVASQSGFGSGSYSPKLVVADFSGDGHQDALVGFDGTYARILLGNEQGHLASVDNLDWSIRDSGGIAVGDVNRDGVADLVAADNTNVNVRLGNDSGGLQSPPWGKSYAAGDGIRDIALGDFDRDGVLDVVFASFPGNSIGILRGREDGTFAAPENFNVGAGPSAVVVADFNGDGWLDVTTANTNGDNVTVLINSKSWGPVAPPVPPVLISIDDASVTEGKRGIKYLTFTVSLSATPTTPVTVNYVTQDGSAIAGSDYIFQNGVLSFAAGEKTKTVRIAILGDNSVEPDESFQLVLSNATGNAVVSDSVGVGLIVNDDAIRGRGRGKK